LAGHNKWSQIKRKKAANDNQRGKVISKHIRAIQSAVREGGSDDTSTNLALKNALGAAKADDVPADNIDRAIERALGGAEGGSFDPVAYEGYGPAGVAFLVEALTDNRNRTVAEVRRVFTKHGGNMSGSTAWQFDAVGLLVFEAADDALQEVAIDLGALDLDVDDEGTLTVYTPPTELYAIADRFAELGFTADVAQLTKTPQTRAALDAVDAAKIVRMVDALEDLDDVQNVYTTADLDAVAEVAQGGAS